jgi:RNA polymerase sigma-70 factor (ECF subfamily)
VTEHEELIKAQSGDHNAFNSLLLPYIPSAYQVAFMLLREKAGADDAVQETLIRTYKSIHRFNPEIASFKTWFHQILLHVTWKMAKRKRFFFPWKDMLDKSREGQPEHIYLQEENQKELYQCIRKLSKKHQTVIILYYMQDLSVSEIASILTVSEGTVKSRLHHARGELKNQLLSSPHGDISLKEGWTWNKN